MDQEKGSVVLCSHYNPQLDKKKLWAVLEEWNKAGAQCYKKHLKEAPAKSDTLLINLGTYKLACSKYTETKCMLHHLKEQPDLCIALNPSQAYVWYYYSLTSGATSATSPSGRSARCSITTLVRPSRKKSSDSCAPTKPLSCLCCKRPTETKPSTEAMMK